MWKSRSFPAAPTGRANLKRNQADMHHAVRYLSMDRALCLPRACVPLQMSISSLLLMVFARPRYMQRPSVGPLNATQRLAVQDEYHSPFMMYIPLVACAANCLDHFFGRISSISNGAFRNSTTCPGFKASV